MRRQKQTKDGGKTGKAWPKEGRGRELGNVWKKNRKWWLRSERDDWGSTWLCFEEE